MDKFTEIIATEVFIIDVLFLTLHRFVNRRLVNRQFVNCQLVNLKSLVSICQPVSWAAVNWPTVSFGQPVTIYVILFTGFLV